MKYVHRWFHVLTHSTYCTETKNDTSNICKRLNICNYFHMHLNVLNEMYKLNENGLAFVPFQMLYMFAFSLVAYVCKMQSKPKVNMYVYCL